MEIKVDLDDLRECPKCGIIFNYRRIISKESFLYGDKNLPTKKYICPCCKHVMDSYHIDGD